MQAKLPHFKDTIRTEALSIIFLFIATGTKKPPNVQKA